MAPMLNISKRDFKRARNLLELANVDYTLPEGVAEQANESNSFYVPSINLNVARERTLQGKNWYETHKEFAKQGSRMLTIPEFVEVLKYARENDSDLYRDITEVKSPWRAEWIDAFFEKRQNGLYVLTGNKTKAEKLDEDTLMDDKRISLESWIENPTKQGLPRKDTKKGDLYFWHPRNGAVARFYANVGRVDFSCYNGDPSDGDSDLGVRAVKTA